MLEIILLGKSKKNTIFSILAFLLSLTLIPFYSIISGELVLIFLLIINFLIVVSLIINKSGLIPCSRYLFLVSPGFIQLLIFILSSGNISVAILANEYIDINLIKFVSIISTIGASSSNLGFSLKPFIIKISERRKTYSKGVNNLFLLFFVLLAIYYGYSLGDSLFVTGQYANNTNSTKMVIGVISVFYFYFLSLFIYSKFWSKENYSLNNQKIYFLIIIIVIIYIAIKGVRQDSIGVLLGLYSIIAAKKKIEFNKSPYFLVLGLFFISWLGSIVTGALRENFSGITLSTLATSLQFIIYSKGYVVFNMNTASMIIGTLNIVTYKTESGFLLGKTYLDWVPRTVPEFLMSNRPEGPEFDMHFNGVWFGWGGIHEVGEAYLNFGYIGIIIIPFIISYLVNSIGKSFLRSSPLLASIPIVWLIMMPRWIWYQSFALYKSTISMILLGIILKYIFKNKWKN